MLLLCVKSLKGEAIDRHRASSVERHLRENLAHRCRMLEAMARARRGDDHARHAGMAIDDEVEIRRGGVEARSRTHAFRTQLRKVGPDEPFVHLALFMRGDFADRGM